MSRWIRGFLWTVLGGGLCGWLANRVCAFLLDHPLAFGESYTADDWLTIFNDPFHLDERTMLPFGVAFGIVALIGMGSYDWTGEKARAKKDKGSEYGDARFATPKEMEAFAHTTLTRVVPIRLQQKLSARATWLKKGFEAGFKDGMACLKTILKGMLGLSEKKPNPVPPYVERMEDDNIILSELAQLQLSKIPDPAIERNKHVYVLGGSGSGKTFNYVSPNLLQMNSSYVVTDPKGDTLKQFGNFFLKHGYKLKVVNTKASEMAHSMRYNPIHYLQNSTSIMQIVNLLIENTSGDAEQCKQDFFVKAETQLYMCLIGYLFYFYADQPQYQTLPQLLDLLQLAEKTAGQSKTPLDVIMLGTTAEDGFEGYAEWVANRHGGDEVAAQSSEEFFVVKQYKGFKSTAGSPETEASVIASCNVRLAPFAVAAVRDFFSTDELELEGIGEEKTAFFLVMSDTDSTFNFILAMLLYQLFDVNTGIADRHPGSHCTIPVQCILDELANIGRIPDLDVKIATLRSRWIYITAILQSATQLKKMYKDNADIIEGNCDTTLFLGRCDHETNKKISERLGKYTITVTNRSETHARQGSWSESENRVAKDLMSASDLGSNPEKFSGDDCLVLIKSAHGFLDKKYRTFDHPRYPELKGCGEFVLEDWNFDRREAERLAALRLAREVAGRIRRFERIRSCC
ncbi:type IV secretory system conjugative DNA transfer family protein [Gordonibacter pamelaeae]|uniref:VirD4-like conjugal transfer protein, CD1115 family n=1 Tax=Gordonibacter pamelaeae TaxID=471189 RepID=UPI00210AEEE9|nr:type IV secretory system conjugative DNA transfer family protein [Gordonibacter pamelaeae]MCQ4848385.1 type IV secretory system conjugative DNA transfer family protein [Gordonibacter pamelaeae]MCQ4850796.1 type IV secretory system conjugative DNA transfer family protein [Gordonibacter pamelaeae]